MKYREQHEAFKRLVIQQGIGKLEQLNQALPFGCSAPSELIDRWLNRLLAPPTSFSCQRRYVNRFKLGADPEFICFDVNHRVDARLLGLQQGLAFGMDNNGRLIEVRPYPSRSALEVVASILATLRWLAILCPKSLDYTWHAGAFLQGDGLGGHVHFGRKRPDRNLEVKALDAVDDELINVKAYPYAEVMRRRQGDEHNQHYGMPGDIRQQQHGYEYRAFPSWLDSPELAFLTITLSKLAVHNPKLLQGYVPLPLEQSWQRIRNLLAYYKDSDDDARLALMLIYKRLPVHVGGDFRARWGIGDAPAAPKPAIQFIPSSIKPTPEEIDEVFLHLQCIKPLGSKVPVPNWKPLNPPEGYVMTITGCQTWGAKGLGELVWDVCQHRSFRHVITNTRDMHACFSIPQQLASTLPEGWQRFTREKIKTHESAGVIYSSEQWREKARGECRRLLLETVLPFWRIDKVKPDSWQQWRASLSERKPKTYAGKVIFGELEALPFL